MRVQVINLLRRLITIYGGVAQLGEHLPCKQGVKSSNLSISIRDCPNRTVPIRTLKTAY